MATVAEPVNARIAAIDVAAVLIGYGVGRVDARQLADEFIALVKTQHRLVQVRRWPTGTLLSERARARKR